MNDLMQQEIQTWPELAIGLYDKLTSRNAEITYEFDRMEIAVPKSADAEAPSATWQLQGSLRIRTRNVQ